MIHRLRPGFGSRGFPIRNFGVRTRVLSTQAKPSTTHTKSRTLRNIVLISGGASLVYVADSYNASIISRSARGLYTFGIIGYYYTKGQSHFDSTEELHQYTADLLLHLLMTNKGIYIKLGQAIANQGAIFPLAYQRNFSKLYDDAATDTWESVDEVLRANLGENYEHDVFESIQHTPMASASIAQVHKAKLKTGEDVAVKVQHHYIKKQIGIDLLVYRAMNKFYEWVFEVPFAFFSKYVADQLIKEVDFVHEMENSERLRQFIADAPENVYVPVNYEKYCTPQVLVSEWIDGVSLVDKQRLIDAKFNISTIMLQYLHIFGRQMFKYGFIHSDPHPGNLLARFDSRGKQQLVILDHGLYVELPDKFRVEYAQLWKCLFAFDTTGIKRIAENWGVGSTDMFASMIQLRPVDPEKIKKDTRDAKELLKNFLSDQRKFPLELVFLSRTMRMMQNLNQQMGSPVNRTNLLTIEAVDSLMSFNTHETKPVFAKITSSLYLLRIRFVLLVSNMVFYLFRLRQILHGDRYGAKGEGMEDAIERYMLNTAKSLGMEVES